jgi:hypothetical protein
LSNTRESNFYPIVAQWLKRYHHCFKTDINKGLRYSRIDVVGVRDIGGDLSGEVETISVEVKKGGEPFATASGQASGYKVYANLVYLADVRKTPFTPDEIDIASHLGIGLIQISGRNCREVLSSPYYKPVTRLNLLLLERLALGRCRLCDCFFVTGDEHNRFSNLARENLKKALSDGKGLMFWNYAVGKRKRKTDATYLTYERRFICPDCIRNISIWREQVRESRT